MPSLGTLGLEFPTVDDGNLLTRSSSLATDAFNCLDHIHTFYDLSKDDMLAIEPLRLGRRQEELTTTERNTHTYTHMTSWTNGENHLLSSNRPYVRVRNYSLCIATAIRHRQKTGRGMRHKCVATHTPLIVKLVAT